MPQLLFWAQSHSELVGPALSSESKSSRLLRLARLIGASGRKANNASSLFLRTFTILLWTHEQPDEWGSFLSSGEAYEAPDKSGYRGYNNRQNDPHTCHTHPPDLAACPGRKQLSTQQRA